MENCEVTNKNLRIKQPPNTNITHHQSFKGRVQCFSMQVVINNYLLLNPEKKLVQKPSCRFREKRKNAHFNSENDVTEPKARLL